MNKICGNYWDTRQEYELDQVLNALDRLEEDDYNRYQLEDEYERKLEWLNVMGEDV